MEKTIRIIGNSKGIIFNREEQDINGLEVGDILEITIIKITKSKKGGKK